MQVHTKTKVSDLIIINNTIAAGAQSYTNLQKLMMHDLTTKIISRYGIHAISAVPYHGNSYELHSKYYS